MSEFILLSSSQDNVDDDVNKEIITNNNVLNIDTYVNMDPVNIMTLTDNVNTEIDKCRCKYYNKLKIKRRITDYVVYPNNSELSRSLPINIPKK